MPTKKRYAVTYTVKFQTTIECEPDDLEQEVLDVDVPENQQNHYVIDSFFVEEVKDTETGEEIEKVW